LENLNALNSLSSIGEDLSIHNNDALLNLSALNKLTAIPVDMTINYNENLISLNGLESVSSIGGRMDVSYNPALETIDNLMNVTSISGDLKIMGNNSLSSLEGLDNISHNSIENLYIVFNTILCVCNVQSVCDYLGNPNGATEIYYNYIGCDSKEEVEEACLVNVSGYNVESEFAVYPNPIVNELTISNINGRCIRDIVIYNKLGQKVLHQVPLNNNINVSKLDRGLYIIEIVTNQQRIRKKIIIEK